MQKGLYNKSWGKTQHVFFEILQYYNLFETYFYVGPNVFFRILEAMDYRAEKNHFLLKIKNLFLS